MQIQVGSIELDTSIQCRASIDTGTVNDYAERMAAGDQFPAVELYGTKGKSWIGDGWHRVMAAKQLGELRINATLHEGGRAEALKAALGANAVHGQRRSNADKRRCVEIALREFPKLGDNAIATLCGVSNHMVADHRPAQLGDSPSSKRTGLDGKERPAKREPANTNPEPWETPAGYETPTERPAKPAAPVLGPPSNGMQFARMAIMDLEQIRPDDAERAEAFAYVKEWIDARES